MLPGVLLHVIEPARPFDFAANQRTFRYRRGKDVHDVIIDFDRFDDLDRPEGSPLPPLRRPPPPRGPPPPPPPPPPSPPHPPQRACPYRTAGLPTSDRRPFG